MQHHTPCAVSSPISEERERERGEEKGEERERRGRKRSKQLREQCWAHLLYGAVETMFISNHVNHNIVCMLSMLKYSLLVLVVWSQVMRAMLFVEH